MGMIMFSISKFYGLIICASHQDTPQRMQYDTNEQEAPIMQSISMAELIRRA